MPALQGQAAPERLPRLAFHPPCTLQHGQRLRGGIESHLRALGFDVGVAGSESHLCCGSAGTYSLLQPQIATQLRDRKLGNLAKLEPQCIVSANMGCIQHLQSGTQTPVMHWIEVLDEALRRTRALAPKREESMCLVLVVWRVHPRYPCLVAANRDEFHARPAAARRLVAGSSADTRRAGSRSRRDLAGHDSHGPICRAHELPRSRTAAAAGAEPRRLGDLACSIGRLGRRRAWRTFAGVGADYNGFNLIFSDGERLGIYESVRGSGREARARDLWAVESLARHALAQGAKGQEPIGSGAART